MPSEGDGELVARVGERYSSQVLARRLREDLLLIGAVVVLGPAALWLTGADVTPASLAGGVIAGAVMVVVVLVMHARRARESVERRVQRERAYSRPCGACGSPVLRFEGKCAKCGAQQTRRWPIERWLPLMIIGVFFLCFAIASALSQ
jgi:hypothetical protein